jgi:predicted dithiol-disulfide oxidoreductase (DUF899 family)
MFCFLYHYVPNGKIWHNYRWQSLQSEEMSGLSVYARTPNRSLFYIYSTFARDSYLDLVSKRRDETRSGSLAGWVRHHNRYGLGGAVDATGRYRDAAESGCCCGEEEQ